MVWEVPWMWFPSVPGLFTEIKLCSIPSPIQQPQEIPVTSSRHKLKNNHPPATETSVLPTSINTHITSATYIHILLCLCPISMLDSEILFTIFFFPPPFSHGWMKPQKAKENTSPCCKHPLKWSNSWLQWSFHLVHTAQISTNSSGQGLASGASIGKMS